MPSSPNVFIGDPGFRPVRSWIPDQNHFGNDGVEKLRPQGRSPIEFAQGKNKHVRQNQVRPDAALHKT